MEMQLKNSRCSDLRVDTATMLATTLSCALGVQINVSEPLVTVSAVQPTTRFMAAVPQPSVSVLVGLYTSVGPPTATLFGSDADAECNEFAATLDPSYLYQYSADCERTDKLAPFTSPARPPSPAFPPRPPTSPIFHPPPPPPPPPSQPSPPGPPPVSPPPAPPLFSLLYLPVYLTAAQGETPEAQANTVVGEVSPRDRHATATRPPYGRLAAASRPSCAIDRDRRLTAVL